MENITLYNLGTVNKNRLHLKSKNGLMTIWFSYSTPVAFQATLNGGITVNGGSSEFWTRQNDWGTTTGKFLNNLQPDKKKRITGDKFEKYLTEALSQL
jgi:hypothetical protein